MKDEILKNLYEAIKFEQSERDKCQNDSERAVRNGVIIGLKDAIEIVQKIK